MHLSTGSEQLLDDGEMIGSELVDGRPNRCALDGSFPAKVIEWFFLIISPENFLNLDFGGIPAGQSCSVGYFRFDVVKSTAARYLVSPNLTLSYLSFSIPPASDVCYFPAILRAIMPKKHVDRVNIIKCVKVAGKWRFAALVEKDGELIRDHVWIRGHDEHHPEGRYFLDWYEAGRRHRRTVAMFDELAEMARHKFKELNGAKSNPRISLPNGSSEIAEEPPRVTLKAAIERYLEFISLHRSRGTFLSYRLTLGLLNQCYRKIWTHEVTRDDILQFMVQCYRRGLSSRTIYGKLVIVLQFFKRYGQTRLVQLSDWPVYVETVRPIYQPEEIELLFRHAGEEERVLLKFLLASGFRDREVRYLTWRDIDFRNCIAQVTAKPAWHFNPKNWKERVVPLPSVLMQQLRNLKERRNAHSGCLVFPNSKGNPNAANIMIVKRVAERAGLNCGQCSTKHGNKCAKGPCRYFYLNKFRHTFATEHLRHGIDIRTLQRWMGHRDIQSTMVYLRAIEFRDALAKVNAGSLAAYITLPHTAERA